LRRLHSSTGKSQGKFEVPETGVSGLNAEKRKEINRIENEDLEWRGKWKDYLPP